MKSTGFKRTDNPSMRIGLPLQGILKDEDGGYAVVMNGQQVPVAYFADVRCWFLLDKSISGHYDIIAPLFLSENEGWHRAKSPEEARRQTVFGGEEEDILLPVIASIPEDAKAIPNTVHLIWVGDRPLPDYLFNRIQINALRCPSFRFILHIHPTTKQAARSFKQVPQRFGRVIVSELKNDSAFVNFLATEAGAYYQHFLTDPHQNYGAASDLLRYFILHDRGGVYMDTDDEIVTQVDPGYQLMAPKHHVLLSTSVIVKATSEPFYANSVFACHSGCSIMADLLHEAVNGLRQNRSFLQSPRPWCTTPEDLSTPVIKAYSNKIIELTGPALFTRVLSEKICTGILMEQNHLAVLAKLYVSPGRPRIIADTYEEQLLTCRDFYLPFSSQNFLIRLGAASTWNIKRPDKTRWSRHQTCT